MLGVINIITRSQANEVGVSAGSLNRIKSHLLASHQFDQLSADVFLHFDQDKGQTYQVDDTFSSNQISTDDPRQFIDASIKLSWQGTHLQILHRQGQTENFYEQNTLSNGFNSRETDLTSVFIKHEFNWLSVDSFLQGSHTTSSFNTATQLTPAGDIPLALSRRRQ